ARRHHTSARIRRPPVRCRRRYVVLVVQAWTDFDLRPRVTIDIARAPGPEKSFAGIFKTEYRRSEENAERGLLIRGRRYDVKNLNTPVSRLERIAVGLTERMTDGDCPLGRVREQFTVPINHICALEHRD